MRKEMKIPDKAIILLIGIAGSGKTTLAKLALKKEAIVVSSDECRKEICGDEFDQTVTKEAFELFYKKIRNGINAQKQVIADATNLDKFSREIIYNIAKENSIPVYALVFNLPLELIKKQNNSRNRVIPDYAMNRMYKKMEQAYYEVMKELPKGHIIDIIPSRQQLNENSINEGR